ncbi:hypothetical protein HanRHA438_Chr11g0531371 [Helianthus annuus]|nr:hypothetical protein HanRHA438_Chr11g0531371 [Helianthus annuus]
MYGCYTVVGFVSMLCFFYIENKGNGTMGGNKRRKGVKMRRKLFKITVGRSHQIKSQNNERYD